MASIQNIGTILLLGIVHMVTSEVTYCGNKPADVVFMIDSSNSIWAPHFQQQLEFVRNVSQMFQIGKNDTQVGLATFNDRVESKFYLNEYEDKDSLLRAITSVRQTLGQSTATDKAIKFMRKTMFNPANGARHNIPRVAIVITDGRSDNLLRTLIEASKAKRHKIHIFTIGVGTAVNKQEIQRMASWPPKEYAFVVDSYSFLHSIKLKLAIQTCKVTTPPPPPTTPTTTTTTTTTTTAATTTTTTTAPTTSTTSTTTTTTTTTTTPTTTTTTTTIPLPTTTTWLDLVREICQKKVVDVVFALDSSDEVTPSDFWYQVKFVRDFTLGLDVGYNKTRIGLVMYNDRVTHGFDVNDHMSLSSAISDLYRLERTFGGTKLEEVIHYVRTKSFSRTVSRRNASQIVLLITSGSSKKLHRVKKEANMARKTGINILTIGVGDRVNKEELRIISGDKHPEENYSSIADPFLPFMENTSNRKRQMFLVDSFPDLENIVQEATIEACTSEVASVAVSDQACGTRQEADVMFVMDSASAGRKNTKKSMDFMKKVASSVDVGKETVQIGVLQPEECIPVGESFRLDSHGDKEHVVSALQKHLDDDFASLMKNMRKDAFKRRKGGRKYAKKIAVLLVDGGLDQPLKALKEARRAKIKGIEVYVIVVGTDTPQPEVQDMCDYPPSQHFFQIPDYDRLTELEDSLIELLCDEL